MRELRAVRVSDDGKEILLAAAAGMPAAAGPADSEFLLPADDRLRGMLRPRPTTSETRPESALSPREIQSRLRAGDTAEDVARAAGIPVTRVARYEAPIAAERVRIVDEVRRATAPGPHRVSPGRQLGAVVDERLTDDGLDPALAQWLARRRPDSTWLVTVDLADHHAEWSWDGTAKRVRAHDSGAQRLLSPSRSSAESLIAVAQAAGVTTEPARAEPSAPLAPARAVGDSRGPDPDAPSGRSTSIRSGLVVLAGEGAAPATVSEPAPTAATLGDLPGAESSRSAAAAPALPAWTSSADDVPGSGMPEALPYEPSASASEKPEIDMTVEVTVDVTAERPARQPGKSTRRRSAVPAWDDIVFGARRS